MLFDFFFTSPLASLFGFFWVQWTFYVAYNINLFWKSRQSDYLTNRSPNLIFPSAIGQYLMITTQVFKIIVKPENFPNFIDHWYLWLALPMHFIAYPLRSLYFCLNIEIKRYHILPQVDKDERVGTFVEKLYQKQEHLTPERFTIYYYSLLGLSFVWGMIRQILVPQNNPKLVGGGTTNVFYFFSFGLLLLVSILLGFAIVYTGRTREELKIKTELQMIAVVWIVFAIPFVIFGNLSLQPKNGVSTNVPPVLSIILCILSFLISFGMPCHLASQKAKKNCFSVDLFGNYEAIESDPEGYRLFVNFMNRRNCIQVVKFLEDLKKFSQMNAAPDVIEREYHKIVDTYILNDKNVLEINISGPNRAFFTQPHTVITPLIFNKVKDEMIISIQADSIPNFVATPEAREYILKKTRLDE